MKWLLSAFDRKIDPPKSDDEYRVAFTLYSEDGCREAKVLEFSRARVYLLESEQGDDGQFIERHNGQLVGPFNSPSHAERFITATPWFLGEENRE